MRLGRAPTPFGEGVFAMTDRGLAGLGFCAPGDPEALEDLRRRWPAADWSQDDAGARAYGDRIFGDQAGEAVPLVLIGPPFQVQVWKALLTIPAGETVTYSEVARRAGHAGAFRAVGAAIGANPISWLIPCHRALARDGRLTGYHWGLPRKAAMLGLEAARAFAHSPEAA
jgi:AraC family transcriptional regulator of adaptative response/methylated-DNA-[protein]-cysteine methyltransferase